MADTTHADKWPVSKFHFLVSFEGGATGDISFSEVSGLDQETDVAEYRHGDSPVFSTIKTPGLVKATNVVLKKGMFKTDSRLTEYFTKISTDKMYYSDKADRLQVTIKLLDEDANPLVTWVLANAFPSKLTGTDLKSDASEIAVESIELAHEGVTVTVT